MPVNTCVPIPNVLMAQLYTCINHKDLYNSKIVQLTKRKQTVYMSLMYGSLTNLEDQKAIII